ncbi:MAG: hypothetical protein LW823_01945 [Rickettsiales bacterium]|jgi:hypothetical protein|nr:hypothetical protein [Rickettsiales bacterium]
MKSLAVVISLGFTLLAGSSTNGFAMGHDSVSHRFFGSLSSVYKASRVCELQNSHQIYQQYSNSVVTYLGHFYEDGIPFWVIPRDQDLGRHGNCEVRLNSALSQYQVARGDFKDYFPEAPVPPDLRTLQFREFKRKPSRAFNIAN